MNISEFLSNNHDTLILIIGIILILSFIFYNRITKENDPMSVSFRFIILIIGVFLLVMTFVF